ncbi:MAG TPA: AmmeMemoRadiSam system protein B [Blastocatellia bacterium]|nr:AmmeMemoRadiSam system protein B [Blastocatellia bacterium]
MSKPVPKLRQTLDVFPSPVEEHPGILLRDPFRYSEEILIIPPALVGCLRMMDGGHTELELQDYLSKLVGQEFPLAHIRGFIEELQSCGFLETAEFEQRRAHRHAEFAAAPFRAPAHAGAAYPDDAASLRETLEGWMLSLIPPRTEPIIGIAAPHVSPDGGWECYAAAYNRLAGMRDELRGKTIVILGTSHYGEPEKFGLTRKPFKTPFGTIETDTELVDRLAARATDAVTMEDYCHVFEHSIEFQGIFLQQMLGNDFKILPVLCGAFVRSFLTGRAPEKEDGLRRFFESLGEVAESHRDRLFWVLGIDLAHIGRRYGDPMDVAAETGVMLEVREADHRRLAHVCRNQSAEFFESVHPEHDPLKWCGFTPLYTFMQSVKGARGNVLKYDQWNIDEQSVVSFAAMEFSEQ